MTAMTKTIRAIYCNADDTIYASFTAQECSDGSIDHDSLDVEWVEFCGHRLTIVRQSRELQEIIMERAWEIDRNEWEYVT